jgi:hypothetical protein
MRRTGRALVLTGALMMTFSLPANAHVIQVTNPHSGEAVSTHKGKAFEELKEFGDFGWVGGFASFAAHGGGLNDACEATSDNEVVSLWGPPNPETCPHGG